MAQTDAPPVITRPETFDLLAGTTRLRNDLLAGRAAVDIVAAWAEETAAFETTVLPYRRYEP